MKNHEWMLALFYIKNRNQTTTTLSQITSRINYFTSKIEIKPQLDGFYELIVGYYFTSKIEIKPQHWWHFVVVS